MISFPAQSDQTKDGKKSEAEMKNTKREDRARLSKCTTEAQAKKVMAITPQDGSAATLIGLRTTQIAGLTRLLASGKVKWEGGKPIFRKAVTLGAGGKKLSEMVLEDRG